LLGNIGRPEEVEHVREHRLGGVGLFRTEFLFLESHEPPSFQRQLDIYKGVAEALGDRPLVIRTFDLGGDKTPPFLASPHADPHPSLALRGLRFSLAERRLFETQLRALVQVAQENDVRLLFPMVIGHHDLSRACAVLADVIADLGVPKRPLLGAMIETPAALFALEEILGLVDFLAIGTNDLTQYMLALDRDEAELSEACTPWHPLVLRAIRRVIEAAVAKGCPVCVCGEEAGEPGFACLLAGLGVRELSLSPGRAARVRHALRGVRCRDAEEVAHKALRCSSPEEVRERLAGLVPPVTQQTLS
jgi:phosphoenolpyruvate-protein phosphotransferase (PTS system enzyme I)